MRHEHLSWPPDDVNAQAAYWWTVLHRPSPRVTEQKAHQLWLDESPHHTEAYRSLCALYEASLGLKDDAEFMTQRRDMMRPRPKFGQKVRDHLAGIAISPLRGIAIGVCVLALGGSFVMWQVRPETYPVRVGPSSQPQTTQQANLRNYRTSIGERSAIELEDSSRVELSTESQVQVDMTRTVRSLVLHKGQALFDVAKDTSRPFIVHAAGYEIVAIGTRFEVRVDGNEVEVVLLEGRVQIKEPPASSNSGNKPKLISVLPQQKFTSANGALETLSSDQTARLLSWRNGRLDFERDALGEVVYEINRYSTQKIRIADPNLHQLLISGSFKIGSAQRFAEALTVAYPIATEVSQEGNEIILTQAK